VRVRALRLHPSSQIHSYWAARPCLSQALGILILVAYRMVPVAGVSYLLLPAIEELKQSIWCRQPHWFLMDPEPAVQITNTFCRMN
jgi:hypothetical protein